MNENLKDLFARLAEPFPSNDIEWRAGATNAEKTKALALAYITSRAVMDRLDEIVGAENWKDQYAPGPDGGVICGLSLRIHEEWITKWDGADNTDFEAIKGGLSDAFKRVGVKWGIGRYLYKLEGVWVPCEARGKTVVLKSIPSLPGWALPSEVVDSSSKSVQRKLSIDPAASKDRENQILKELGFDVQTTAQDVPIPVIAAVPSNGNGKHAAANASPTNGNGSNGAQPKISHSWSSNFVTALIKAGLAANPAEAVRLLNASSLPQNVTPEQAIEHIKSQPKS